MRVNKLFLLGICGGFAFIFLNCSGGGSGNSGGLDTSQLKGSWQESSLQSKNDGVPRLTDNNGYIDVSPRGTTAGPDLQKVILSFDGSSNIVGTYILKNHGDHSGIVNATYKVSGNKITFIFPDVTNNSQETSTIRKLSASTLELVADEDNSVTILTRISDDKVSAAQSELNLVRGMPAGSTIGCYAVSDDIVKLSSALKAMSNCQSEGKMTMDQMSNIDCAKTCPGDVIVCAGQAAFSGDQAEKAIALKAVKQVEVCTGAEEISPDVVRAFGGLKSALGAK